MLLHSILRGYRSPASEQEAGSGVGNWPHPQAAYHAQSVFYHATGQQPEKPAKVSQPAKSP